MTLAELAARLRCRLEGDGAIEIARVARIDEAGPGDVTFLTNAKYGSKLAGTRAAAIILDDSVSGAPCAVLRTDEPYLAFADAVELLMVAPGATPMVSPTAVVDPSASVGPDVSIAPFACIGPRARIGARTRISSHVVIGADVTIGEDCLMHAHVSIRERVVLGHRVMLQARAVLGNDGFGFARRRDTCRILNRRRRVKTTWRLARCRRSPGARRTRITSGAKIDNRVKSRTA